MYQFLTESSFAAKWIISREKLISLGHGHLYSEAMNVSKIPNLRYCLDIYPNCNEDEFRSHVRCYLFFRSETAKTITASFTITIKSTPFKHVGKDRSFDGLNMGYGGILCTNEELFDPGHNGFIDDMLTIKLKGIVHISIDYTNLFLPLAISTPSDLVKRLWKNEEKDGKIVSNEQTIMYHKVVLSLDSPFFKTSEETIQINDFDADIIKLAIEFCYERNISEKITAENECDILKFADKYSMIKLKKFMEVFLLKKLNKKNVAKYANLSLEGNAKKLKEYCICFLMRLNDEGIFIANNETLNDKIYAEIGRRSTLNICKSL